MQHRLRFAPSPTGQVHIGNIRTAIFNWLAARHMGGKFILRIKDTDLERSTEEAIDALPECMEWLGLDYDEEVLCQTTQAQYHLDAAKKLMEDGNADPLGPATEHSPILFRSPVFCDDFPFVRTVGPELMRAALAKASDTFDLLPENNPKAVEDALRVAVCGFTIGAGICETVVCIGVNECARRTRAALAATA